MKEKKEDRRVRRTQAALRQSLTALLSEKGLREITVKELTERADVNRGTFYTYYQDIYDMVQQLEDELFEEFEAVISAYPVATMHGGEDIYRILRDVLAFLRRNADFCTILIGNGKDSSFIERLKALVYEKVDAEWGQLYQFPTPRMRAVTMAFLVGGVIGMIQAWIANGWQETPEELAGIASQLIVRGLSEMGTLPE